jgi:hypothetical protein
MTIVNCHSYYECPRCGENYPYFTSDDIDRTVDENYHERHTCEKCGSEYWAWVEKYDWCPFDHFYHICNLYTRLIDEA